MTESRTAQLVTGKRAHRLIRGIKVCSALIRCRWDWHPGLEEVRPLVKTEKPPSPRDASGTEMVELIGIWYSFLGNREICQDQIADKNSSEASACAVMEQLHDSEPFLKIKWKQNR